MTEFGTVVNVAVATLGGELAADATVSSNAVYPSATLFPAATVYPGGTTLSTALTLVDAADFSEDGGSLTVGSETVEYLTVDDETGVVTLAAALTAYHATGDRVDTYPRGYVKTAQVVLGDDTESVEARVPHALWDRIPEGTRDDSTAESVSLDYADGGFLLSDVLGSAPIVDASFLDAASLRDAIPADYQYLGNVAVENLVGRFLLTQMVMALDVNSVARSEMDADGFRAYRTDGSVFFNVSPAQALVIADGVISALNLTTTQGSSLGGVTEIAKGGALRLTKGTTHPANAPTVTTGYASVQFTNDAKWPNRSGWTTDGTYWYTARIVSERARVEKWSATGTLVATSESLSFTDVGVAGVAVSGGYLFVLRQGPVVWQVRRYIAATLAEVDAADWFDSNGDRLPAIGADPATGELLIAQSRTTDDRVRIRRYTYTNAPAGSTAATLSAGTFVDTAADDVGDLAGVVYGAFDLGASRYVYGKRGGAGRGLVRVLNTSGVRQSGQEWAHGATDDLAGVAWDGTAFRSMSQSGLQRTYTGVTQDTLYWSNTLRSATAETDQSPRAMLTGTRRKRITVTTSSIETTGDVNDPNAVSIYAGTAAARTSMWRQSPPANGVTTKAYTAVTLSGTNPPVNNGFATGVLAALQTHDGTAMIDALGALPASPLRDSVDARIGSRVKPFVESVVLDGAGDGVITHGFGVTPTTVHVTSGGAVFWGVVTARTPTTFTVNLYSAAGALITSTSRVVQWTAFA